jgi:hypothetical protein
MDGDSRGGDVMKDIAKIVVAILLIIVAWKIIKGLFGLLLGVAAAGLLVWGGMKLLEGPKR